MVQGRVSVRRPQQKVPLPRSVTVWKQPPHRLTFFTPLQVGSYRLLLAFACRPASSSRTGLLAVCSRASYEPSPAVISKSPRSVSSLSTACWCSPARARPASASCGRTQGSGLGHGLASRLLLCREDRQPQIRQPRRDPQSERVPGAGPRPPGRRSKSSPRIVAVSAAGDIPRRSIHRVVGEGVNAFLQPLRP